VHSLHLSSTSIVAINTCNTVVTVSNLGLASIASYKLSNCSNFTIFIPLPSNPRQSYIRVKIPIALRALPQRVGAD
jgi:hypothetical protein